MIQIRKLNVTVFPFHKKLKDRPLKSGFNPIYYDLR